MHYYQSPYLKDRGLRSGSSGKRYNSQEGLYTTPSTSNRYTRAASLDTPTSSSYLSPTSTSHLHNHHGGYQQQLHGRQPARGGPGQPATTNNSSTKTGQQQQQGESIQGMLNNFSKALGKTIYLFVFFLRGKKEINACVKKHKTM